jgi:hypothetical protein
MKAEADKRREKFAPSYYTSPSLSSEGVPSKVFGGNLLPGESGNILPGKPNDGDAYVAFLEEFLEVPF